VWRYRIERLADSHQSHFIQVVTKTSSEGLTARLFTNMHEWGKVANLSVNPLAIYVDVSFLCCQHYTEIIYKSVSLM